jgi:hypothetical protein
VQRHKLQALAPYRKPLDQLVWHRLSQANLKAQRLLAALLEPVLYLRLLALALYRRQQALVLYRRQQALVLYRRQQALVLYRRQQALVLWRKQQALEPYRKPLDQLVWHRRSQANLKAQRLLAALLEQVLCLRLLALALYRRQ